MADPGVILSSGSGENKKTGIKKAVRKIRTAFWVQKEPRAMLI
jgi:hypothetical protein